MSDPLADLGEAPQNSGATGTQPGDTDTDCSNVGLLIQPRGYCCWQAPFWSPPSSLLVPGTRLTHQPVNTNLGTTEAEKPAMRGQSPSTSRLELAMGPPEHPSCPGNQPHPPEGLGPSSAHQLAGTRTGTPQVTQPAA